MSLVWMLSNFLKRLMTAICLLIFLHIEATWLLKFSRSSMCTPSNLQVVEGSINVPSTEKLIFLPLFGCIWNLFF